MTISTEDKLDRILAQVTELHVKVAALANLAEQVKDIDTRVRGLERLGNIGTGAVLLIVSLGAVATVILKVGQ